MLIQALGGAAGGGLAVLVARRWVRERQPVVFALGLVATALVYLVIAIAAGDWDALPAETSGLLLFAALAGLGLRAPRLLALGWAAHALWDVALHRPGLPDAVPDWYPWVCVGFDLVVAAYALIALRRR